MPLLFLGFLFILTVCNVLPAWSYEFQWNGHVRARASVSWPDDESVFQAVGVRPYFDGSGEFRLKNKVFLGDWGYVETHYEAIVSGGDTREKKNSLARVYPDLFKEGPGGPPNDDLRLMDLTHTLDANENSILYHRLDRLSLTVEPTWGTLCLGRQALTWGNGMLFNPMDLFNPFSPTDIERDYKTGDDMVSIHFPAGEMGNAQFLYVPRRDPVTHDVEWDCSSLGGKLHVASGTTEFDVMAARHYSDYVAGFGITGYVGDAVWRVDTTWTCPNKDKDESGFLSLVANMDYSWVWWGKNFYGFTEFYHNGLGDDDYAKAMADPEVFHRLGRGEMFTLGRAYVSGHISMELHPLFNVYVSVINNLGDPSGVIQPRAVWDVSQNMRCVFGGNMYYGGRNTEFGGFRRSKTNFLEKPYERAFVWLTWFF